MPESLDGIAVASRVFAGLATAFYLSREATVPGPEVPLHTLFGHDDDPYDWKVQGL